MSLIMIVSKDAFKAFREKLRSGRYYHSLIAIAMMMMMRIIINNNVGPDIAAVFYKCNDNIIARCSKYYGGKNKPR